MKQAVPVVDAALEHGPPAAVDVEKLILGALLNGEPIGNVAAVLREQDFFTERNRRIYSAMLELERNGEPISRVTVAKELQRRKQLEADGVSYLASLDDGMPQVVTLDAFVRIVHDKSILRQAIFVYKKGIDECVLAIDPTPEILSRAERTLAALATETSSVSFRTPAEVLDDAGGMSAIVNPPRENSIATPWAGLNSMLLCGGFMPGQMVVIGARPSMGKTALACQIADFVAGSGIGVAFFSLEMPSESILFRMAAARACVDAVRVTQRKATEAERHNLSLAFGELKDTPCLWVDDTTGCTVPSMQASLRKLLAKHSIRLVVVDYLQLVETSGRGVRTRYEVVTEISRGLKRMAREFNLALIVLAQLNREVDKGPASGRPKLSDLRDSGAIEQDADLVLLPATKTGQNERADPLDIELIIAKQRNGPRAIVPLKFMRRFAKFVEPDAIVNKSSQADLGDVA